MTNKERLEEFRDYINYLDDSQDMQDHGRFIDTLHSLYEDGWFHWVYKYAKKQAKRVQELEVKAERVNNKANYFKKEHSKLAGVGGMWINASNKLEKEIQQNQRYREAFKQIKLQILFDGAIEDHRENIIEIIDEALEREST